MSAQGKRDELKERHGRLPRQRCGPPDPNLLLFPEARNSSLTPHTGSKIPTLTFNIRITSLSSNIRLLQIMKMNSQDLNKSLDDLIRTRFKVMMDSYELREQHIKSILRYKDAEIAMLRLECEFWHRKTIPAAIDDGEANHENKAGGEEMKESTESLKTYTTAQEMPSCHEIPEVLLTEDLQESGSSLSELTGEAITDQGQGQGQGQVQVQDQGPEFANALGFLDQVQMQFGEHSDEFRRLLVILRVFEARGIDMPDVVARVSVIFSGHPGLIQTFTTFVPLGYRMESGTNGNQCWRQQSSGQN
jgi:hypothetical protein